MNALENIPPTPSDAQGFTDPDGYVWPAKQELNQTSRPAPLRLDFLDTIGLSELRQFVEGLAEEIQVPVEAVFFPLMAAFSVTLGRKFVLQPYGGSTTVEVPVLWCLLVMPPGSRKSSVCSRLKAPFVSWLRENHKNLLVPLARYHGRQKDLDEQIKGCRQKLGRSKQGNDDVAELQTRIDALVRQRALLPDLAAPALVQQDTTAESLRHMLERNGELVLIMDDEAALLENVLGRYSNGAPNLNLLLKLKTGSPDEAARVSSVGTSLEGPCGAIAMFVQPSVIKAMLEKPEAQGRGFVQRFLLVQPDDLVGRRKVVTTPVDPRFENWWSRLVHRFLEIPWRGCTVLNKAGQPVKYDGEPKVVQLDPAAQWMFNGFRTNLESKLKDGSELADMREWGSKLPGEIARFALCFQLMADPDALKVGVPAILTAMKLAGRLTEHYRHVVVSQSDPTLQMAQKLYDALVEGGGTSSSRDLFDQVRTKNGRGSKTQDWDPAIDLLVSRGLIKEVQVSAGSKGGRPSNLLQLRPE